MAAHRYWRLYISRTGGATSVSVGELILATTPSGPQAATGGTASASSVNGANVASLAFDGTMSSANYWQSASGGIPAYIQYDMGSGNGIDVVEMRLYFNGATAGATTYPSDFVLLYSDDGNVWTLQRAWSGQTFTNGQTKTFDATPLPSNQVFNHVITRYGYRHYMNAGAPPGVLRVLPHRLIGFGDRHDVLGVRCVLPHRLIGFGDRHDVSGARCVLPHRLIGFSVHHCTVPTAATPWSGRYFIAGTTTALGMPFACRVDLVDQKSGILAQQVFTKEDGQFQFEWIGPGPWTLVGVDTSAQYNSVIYAHVTPASMT